MKRLRVILLLVLSGIAGFSLSLYTHRVPQLSTVQQRETYHYPATFVKQLQGDPRAGEKIFREFCSSCHGREPTIAIQAPRIGDKKVWQIKKQMGSATLLKLTIQGIGAMPARGGCFECSDEQLNDTITYMLSQ